MKKRLKQKLAALLAVSFAVSLLPVAVIQAEAGEKAQIAAVRATGKSETVEKADTQSTAGTKKKAAQKNGYIVTIDPGHQYRQNSQKEKIGPGAGRSQVKAKVSSGTQGVVTKVPEYKLNLRIAKKLRKELIRRGYTVVMTRTKNKVNISNKGRAQVANKAHSDIYIRIHADSSGSRSVHGVSTLCMSKKNPYNGKLHRKSYYLSSQVLSQVCKATGAKKRGVFDNRDDLTGNNWSKCPVTLIETGFMSNPKEDRRLNKSAYQDKIAKGIANGIDRYFAKYH